MCGRYTLTQTEDLGDFFEISDTRLPPRFNIAPTQVTPVVRLDEGGSRELVHMRWGLLDPWSLPGTGHINARSESAADRKSFAEAFRRRRCLVPADGFFEWQRAGGVSHPFYVRRRDQGLFALAGIWEPHATFGETFAVLTCDAAPSLASVHDRMPVMLRRQPCSVWLDPTAGRDDLELLLAPYPDELLELVEVGRLVNNVANDSPECIEPADHHQVQGKLF